VNLLLVNYEYPPIGGGAATASRAIARAWRRTGHDVVVLTSGTGDMVGEHDEDGVRVIRLHVGRRAADRSAMSELLLFGARGWLRARDVAAAHRIDAVVAFFTIPSGVVARRIAGRRGVPYVVSLRGADVPGFLPELDRMHRILAPVRRRILRGARAVVANSPSLAALSMRTDPGEVQVVRNGVDTEYFSPAPTARSRSESDPFRLLAVGRFHAHKNHAFLIRALAALPESVRARTRLDLVGDGPDRAMLESQAAAAGVAGIVAFRGWMERDRLHDLYREADCFVMPSVREGMPNVALEALASGLPVLASRAPGHEDVVIQDRTGYLFGLDGPEEFVSLVARLADDADLCAQLGAEARRVAVAEHSWERTASAYLEFFERVGVARGGR